MNILILLQKYISDKIKAEDFKTLRRATKESSDNDLSKAFEALWMESNSKPMDTNLKLDIQESLNKKISSAPKSKSRWKNIAVSILLPTVLFSTAYLFIRQKNDQMCHDFSIVTAKGQKSQIHLPDGTKVWLNSGSHLTYNSDYNQNNRSVKLMGEAFFDVEKKAPTNFTVETGGISVIVYGTAFNVTAYGEDSTLQVSLNRGDVLIKKTNSENLIARLSPNEQVDIRKDDFTYQLSRCDADAKSLWMQNKLKFENASTEELYKKMEYWYGVNIHVENNNLKNKYALTIKSESLREMLSLINKITPITYTINGEEVNIKYVE